MTTGITHADAADSTFTPEGAIEWQKAHVLTEAGGQALTIAGIADGQYLKRSGTTIASGTPPASSDVVYSAAPNTDFDLTNGGAGGAVSIVNQSIASIGVGDQIEVEIVSTMLNNSGVNRTYTPVISLGSFSVWTSANSFVVNTNAANRAAQRFLVTFGISATNLATAMQDAFLTNAFVAGAVTSATDNKVWNSTTSDLTGTQTFLLTLTSNSATTTQTLTLNSVSIRKIPTT